MVCSQVKILRRCKELHGKQKISKNCRRCEISGYGTNPGTYELQMVIKYILLVTLNKTAKWVKTRLSANRTHGCDSHPDLSFSGNNNYPVRPALVDATRTQFCHFQEITNTQCDPHRPVRPAPAKSRDCSDDRWITAGTSRCTWVRSAPMDATRSGSNQWPRFTVQDTETRVRLALTGATRTRTSLFRI